ncbi:SAVED domain-containing protein [Rahnella sp. CG8]|uniref:SAVED domain-containing protein n=1 Tax=Yersiniaceae TaxID=1903411 RepID=UPI001013C4E0|nr:MULTISPECIES: SAVED domain-containing protein [Yersiniaceae]MCM2446230.1 SAVED domain-containing protein [Rahnella sp. CG8]
MANAVVAGWQGHDYQARLFWYYASFLKDRSRSDVIEVSYEADAPKAFDDVVAKYHPPRPGYGSERIAADYFQIKYHVVSGGRFGFKDMVDPEFINAKSTSLLQRLRDAKQVALPNSAFILVTTDTIRDSDELGKIHQNTDGSLDLNKLAVGKTDRSEMGKVRKLWREHLELSNDEELYEILRGFRIESPSLSLERLRYNVNLQFKFVGMIPCESNSDFRYDGLIRALKGQGKYQFNRTQFEEMCAAEQLLQSSTPEEFRAVALRSYRDGPFETLDASPEYTLSLLKYFEGRFPAPGAEWVGSIQPVVTEFLVKIRQAERGKRIRIFLDAHTSIAMLAGKCLGTKCNVAVELVQKGKIETSVWNANDGGEISSTIVNVETLGSGQDVAIVLSITRNALLDAREYIETNLPQVGRILHFTPEAGYGFQSIKSGAHASDLAEVVARAFGEARVKFKANVHIFSAAPNAVNFYVGQQTDYMGSCVFYEFDFNRQRNGSYLPSFRV